MTTYTYGGKRKKVRKAKRKARRKIAPPKITRTLMLTFTEDDKEARMKLEGFGPGNNSTILMTLGEPTFTLNVPPIYCRPDGSEWGGEYAPRKIEVIVKGYAK
jgi:hypothetical protein